MPCAISPGGWLRLVLLLLPFVLGFALLFLPLLLGVVLGHALLVLGSPLRRFVFRLLSTSLWDGGGGSTAP